MKRGKFVLRFIKIAFVMVFSLVVSACSFQKDVNVRSIEVIKETVPEFIMEGEFDKAGIKALVTYEDDSTKIIEINSNLLKDAYQEYINEAGEYEIELLFKGASTKLKVKIVNEEEIFEVNFYNGLNELVSKQFVEKGKAAIAPSGKSHLLHGYEFVGWDRSFENVEEDINVYAIYTRIGKVEEEIEIDYQKILLEAVENMRSNDLNILDVWELSSKRIETTNYYKNLELQEVVTKIIEENREVSFGRYFKEANEVGNYAYMLQKSDGENIYSEIAISYDEFNQHEIYSFVKKIISLTDQLKFSARFSLNREFYKLVVEIPNEGDGGHASEKYEFLFNNEQIISLRHLLVNKNSVGLIEEELTSTKYYTINPKESEKMVFPKEPDLPLEPELPEEPAEPDLLEIANNAFNYDVVVKVEEMRDMMVEVERIRNDAENRAALITRGQVDSYMWDKDEATYYTKEQYGLNDMLPKVYKTVTSQERYGKEYYYMLKELSQSEPYEYENEDGSITFLFEIAESSSNRAHKLRFIVLNNKLVEIERYYYEANELVVISRVSFEYQQVDVEVPQALLNCEPNAILE